MENPSIAKGIENKLVLSSSSNVAYGSGVNTFQVNPHPVNDIHIQNGNKQTVGAKYITENLAPDYAVGSLPYITGTVAQIDKWNATASSNAVINTVINIIGVNENNVEVTENISISGTSTIPTAYYYKCINDIKMVSGAPLGAGVYIYVIPNTGLTPLQDLRVALYNHSKVNPYFMVGSKNGVSRKAKLRSIVNLYNVTASSNIGLHILSNNVVQPAGNTTKGVVTPALRMMDLPAASNLGITFPEDGAVELNMGEMACWYRDGTSTTATYVTASWSFHNI